MVDSKILIFLPLLLTVGVVWSRQILTDEDGNTFQPFMTNSQKRRICVDLCLTGLGGSPCGSDCSDILPHNLPIQLSEDMSRTTHPDTRHVTRNSSCQVLCKNNLGNPLCSCDNVNFGKTRELDEVNFVEICSDFCLRYDYKISGCQKCSIYQALFTSESNGFASQSLMSNTYNNIDWYTWCQDKCGKGDGGAACNCDRLPI